MHPSSKDVVITAGTCLSQDELASSVSLMLAVWPAYTEIFRGEMAAYQAFPHVFTPYYATAMHDGKAVGFAVLQASVVSTDLLSISWVAVHENFRMQKIGEKLISACIEEAKRREKTVLLTTSVPKFYLGQGFDLVDEYDDGEFLLKFSVESRNGNRKY